jgi:hypothetical protein
MTDQPIEELPTKKPQSAQRSSFPFGVVAVLIAIGGIVWGAYEHHHSGELQTALTQAGSQSSLLTQELAAKDDLVNSLPQQLNQLRQKNMPIAIVMRRAQPQSGLTAFFKNNAPAPMSISVILSNPTTGRRREANMVIPPNEIRSIGEPEGWVFAPGHVIQMTQEQFGTVEFTVPAE